MDNQADGLNEAERNFRWAYQLLMVLAKKLLDEANASLPEVNRREWDGMMDSSKAAWITKARDLAGIDHDAFLAPIRSGQYKVDDIYYATKEL